MSGWVLDCGVGILGLMDEVEGRIEYSEEEAAEYEAFEEESPFKKVKKALFNKKLLLLVFTLIFIILAGSGFGILTKKRKPVGVVSPLSFSKSEESAQPEASKSADLVATPSGSLKEVIGFLPSWIVAKNAPVDPKLLTQIIYFGLGVNENGELIKFDENGQSTYEWSYLNSYYFSNLAKKAKENKTKVLLAIKSFDNETIDTITSSPVATQNLILGLLDLIDHYNLDGVNVDFEYMTATDFPTSIYLNNFLEKLSLALKEKNPSLIVSIDIYANAVLNDKAYDIKKIGEIVDQIILMAYDFHRAESTRAGPIAPMRAGENEHCIEESMEAIYGKLPKEKVILGVPFYGYEWQTTSEAHKSPTVPGTGALATYKRIKELLKNPEIKVHWDQKAMAPWLVYRQGGAIKQIYFEDEKSLSLKIQLAERLGFSGIGIWALGYEGEGAQLWETIEQFLISNFYP